MENRTVAGHDVSLTYSYNEYEEDYVSDLYFSSGDSIYRIRWTGNTITPEIEGIIESAPPSDLASERFYGMLEQAKANEILDMQIDAASYDDHY